MTTRVIIEFTRNGSEPTLVLNPNDLRPETVQALYQDAKALTERVEAARDKARRLAEAL